MMRQLTKTTNTRRRPALHLAGTLAAGLLLTPLAPAQESELEYEQDEGYHEEEWWDPTDWFNEDDEIDYESESEDQDLLGDSSGYYDGYHDGYHDDQFGYDGWDESWDTDYKTTYSDGYYDGYYDALRTYEYNPYWYSVSIWDPVDSTSDEDRKAREKDSSRKRGDRSSDAKGESAQRTGKDAMGEGTDGSKEARADEMSRVRGTLASLEQLQNDAKDGHAVFRVRFEDGSEQVIDFGPKMTRADMPVEKGDRFTVIGDERERNEREVLVACKVQSGDETYRLRGKENEKPGASKDSSMKDGKRSNPRRGNGDD